MVQSSFAFATKKGAASCATTKSMDLCWVPRWGAAMLRPYKAPSGAIFLELGRKLFDAVAAQDLADGFGAS